MSTTLKMKWPSSQRVAAILLKDAFYKTIPPSIVRAYDKKVSVVPTLWLLNKTMLSSKNVPGQYLILYQKDRLRAI